MTEPKDPTRFDTDDAALIIGRHVIEIFVLRRGLDDLRAQQAELQKALESVRSERKPTMVVVERAEEGADTDASDSGSA